MSLNAPAFRAYLRSRQYSPDYIASVMRRLTAAEAAGVTEADILHCTPMQLSRKVYGNNVSKSVRKAITTVQNRYCDYLGATA